jgi:hypothetical protein
MCKYQCRDTRGIKKPPKEHGNSLARDYKKETDEISEKRIQNNHSQETLQDTRE